MKSSVQDAFFGQPVQRWRGNFTSIGTRVYGSMLSVSALPLQEARGLSRRFALTKWSHSPLKPRSSATTIRKLGLLVASPMVEAQKQRLQITD